MQHGRNRRLKALAAALAVAALAAPVTQAGVQTDARHQALVDKASQVRSTPITRRSSGTTIWAGLSST